MNDDLVKRLIYLGHAEPVCHEAVKRIEELSGAIKDYLSGHYPHPKTYRPDQCPHGKHHWEHCEDCDLEYWKSKGFA